MGREGKNVKVWRREKKREGIRGKGEGKRMGIRKTMGEGGRGRGK